MKNNINLTEDEKQTIEYLLEDAKREAISNDNWSRVDRLQKTIDKVNGIYFHHFEYEGTNYLKVNIGANKTPPLKTNPPFRKTYNSKETQEILDVSKSTLDKMCFNRQIPFYIHPQRRKRIFFESDLIAYQNDFVRVKL